MKKIIISVLVIVVVILLVLTQKSRNETGSTIKIGATEALTGSAAYYGEQAKTGIDLGLEWLKAKYPNKRFEIFHEDNQFNPKVAIDAYRKLKDQNKIVAVITHNSPSSVAILPLSQKDNIIQMAVSAAASAYSTPDDLAFRTTGISSDEVKPLASYIDSHFKSVAIIYMNNEIGNSEANDLVKSLKQVNKVKIVLNESYPVDAKDFRTTVVKLKSLGPDAVYIAGLASHIVDFVKQTKEFGTKYQILSFRTAEDPSIYKGLGNDANGIIFTNFFDPLGTSTANIDFVSNYKNKYGKNPDSYAAEGYEATRMVGEALVKCDKDVLCTKDFFSKLDDHVSIFGNIKFDSNGDIHHNYVLQKIEGENFITIY